MKNCYLCHIIVIALLFALSLPAFSQKYSSLAEIQEGWQSKPIKGVANGSISMFVSSFDKVWPTGVVGDVREVAERGLSQVVLDKDTEYTVVIDAKNGYAETYDLGSDRAFMQACVWRRQNGHRLFAIMVGQPVDPEMSVICFYDYDAQTKTLTPEPSILNEFFQSYSSSKISYTLPRNGKTLYLNEFLPGWEVPLQHVFSWNGMQPEYDHTVIERLHEMAESVSQIYAYDDEPVSFTEYAVVDIDLDDHSELLLRNHEKFYKAVFAITSNGFKLLADADGRTDLVFYKNAVGTQGSCGTGCQLTTATPLKNSLPLYTISGYMQYDMEGEVAESNFTRDDNDISEQTFFKLLESLGDVVDVEPVWHVINSK